MNLNFINYFRARCEEIIKWSLQKCEEEDAEGKEDV